MSRSLGEAPGQQKYPNTDPGEKDTTYTTFLDSVNARVSPNLHGISGALKVPPVMLGYCGVRAIWSCHIGRAIKVLRGFNRKISKTTNAAPWICKFA